MNAKRVPLSVEEILEPGRTALLLVDIQNDYAMPGGYLQKQGYDITSCNQIIPRAKRVLDAARRAGVLVVFAQMTYYAEPLAESPSLLRTRMKRAGATSPNGLPPSCIEGTWGWQIVEELKPLPGEIIIRKHRNSAFHGTDLDLILRSNGITSVAVTGVVTNACVLASFIDCSAFDYFAVLLKDCVASTRREMDEAARLIMGNGGDVLDSDEAIRIWSSGSHGGRK
ncbi:MAG: cysteine hydrolase [Chloroflexi bacterium]|nr:cysteine hydrolase [Chloroflexota bacterium]